MKKLVTIAGLFLLASILLIGCAPQQHIFSDFDRSANIEEYRTFGWLAYKSAEEHSHPLYYNELNDKRIKTAVADQLEARGYQYNETKPELLIRYHIIIEDNTIVRTDPYGYYYSPYWVSTEVALFKYREGTLIIDLMDAETNSLIWRGWTTNFMKHESLENFDKNIKEAVFNIFTKFPYKAKPIDEPID
jgi:hypothetical protein